MNLERRHRKRVLTKVARLVERRYFDPGFQPDWWRALVAERSDRMLREEDTREFEKLVHDLVSQLGSSHTAFFHRNLRPLPPRQAICATLQDCDVQGEQRWMFEDVQDDGPASEAGLEPGDLLITLDGADARPPKPPVFSMGVCTTIIVQKRDGREVSIDLNIPRAKSTRRPFSLPRAVTFWKIEPSIGYLKVNMFPGLVGIDVSHDIDRAISALNPCDRLVIDLRGNSGGGLGALRLMSYLTPDRLPVGHSVTRARAKTGYHKEKLVRFGRIPSHKWALPWLALRYAFIDHSIALVTEGLGPKSFHARIVLLVNRHSASASEMVAAFAKEYGLAKIVGTTTPGRLVSSRPFKLPYGYFLLLPVGAYVTWHGSNFEGRGVTPDIEVGLSYTDLLRGEDSQLNRALEVANGL